MNVTHPTRSGADPGHDTAGFNKAPHVQHAQYAHYDEHTLYPDQPDDAPSLTSGIPLWGLIPPQGVVGRG